MYFLETLQYVHHVMGVCCIVFDVGGMLFEFFMNFCRKTILSHFAFYAIFNITYFFLNIEKYPFTYWLNGRWFLQIVDRDSGNLYPIYKIIMGIHFFFRKTILFHLMFFCVFLC